MPNFSIGNNQITVLEGQSITATFTAGVVVSYVTGTGVSPLATNGNTFYADPQGTVTYDFWVPVGGSGSYTIQSGTARSVDMFVGSTTVSDPFGVQAAIDAAPNNLVTVVTSGIVDLSGGVYAVPATAAPTRVFLDGDEAQRSQAALESGVLNDPLGGYANALRLWAWDTTNSRVIFYNAGASATRVVLASYWRIDLPAGTFDGWSSKPGVIVNGAGSQLTAVKQLTNRAGTVPTITPPFQYVVQAAECSGYRNLTLIRDQRVFGTSSDNVVGEFFPRDTRCSNFEVYDAPMVVDSSFNREDATYRVGIWYGPNGASSSRHIKRVRSPINNYAAVDSFETFSFTFSGVVEFIDSPVSGPYFIDGASNTFLFINSPHYLPNDLNNKYASFYADLPYAYNFLSVAPATGYSAAVVYVNSPIYAPASSTRTAGAASYAIQWDGRAGIEWYNSSMSGCGAIVGSVTITAANAAKLRAVGSVIPPVLTGNLSASALTPRIPLTSVGVVSTNSGTTELVTGAFSMTYENLVIHRKARVLVAGQFAADGDTKTIAAKMGIVGSLATMTGGSTSGAYNGATFRGVADITFNNDYVTVSVTLLSSAFTRVEVVQRQALTAGQSFGFYFGCTGTNSSDFSVYDQQVALG